MELSVEQIISFIRVTLSPIHSAKRHLLRAHEIKLFACTNQQPRAPVAEFMDEFKSCGFDDAFICPHGPDDGCVCRKPKPGLLFEAAEKYQLDLSETIFIGNTGTDMCAADAAGTKKILVRTGWGEGSLHEYRHT
jgi:histidinol phosphatase-like enzyme